MILFFKNGGLGNQILQYSGLQHKFPNQKIILFGFDTLEETLTGINAKVIGYASNNLILIGVLNRFCGLLCRLRLISYAIETVFEGAVKIQVQHGLIRRVIFVKSCFFQDAIADKVIPDSLALKAKLMEAANVDLSALVGQKIKSYKVFVHIRRGDYVSFPTKESPAVIPLRWYLENMDYFRNTIRNPIFVVCTDDIPYAEEAFSGIGDVFIFRGNVSLDFTVMSQCDSGILSASSFSWCAAFFSNRSRDNENLREYRAPEFWLGHKRDKWIPIRFKHNWLEYIRVR
jgi:hypothetical protein